RQQRDQLRRFGWYRSDGPVFPGLGGAWRKTSVVLKPTLARQLLQRAGLAKRVDAWNTHSLRHTFATLEVNSSRDLKATAARTGHSDLRVLQGYIHQLGVGLPESAVSPLPPELLPAREIPPEPLPELPPPGALCDLMQATGARVREFERERAEQKQLERADSERPFEELALEWLRAGRQPAPRPKAVTLAVRRAYVRAYNREKYQGKPRELCAAAGRRSERAALGAWGQALKRAERLLAAESEPEPEAAAT